MSATHSRGARGRVGPDGGPGVPEPPDSSFWLERTPLPVPRRPDAGKPGRAALAPPGTVCPKCDSPLSPSERACPSCGLKRVMFGRYRAGHADRVPAVLEELWRQVEAEWTDPALHERFMAQVSLCGAYAYAASRYRRAAKQRKSDAIAALQLERLSRMVHAVMAVSSVRAAEERGAHPYRRLVVLVLFLVGIGAVGVLYMVRRGAPTQGAVDRVPPSIKVRRGRSLGADGKAATPFGGLRPAQVDSVQKPREEEGEPEPEPESGTEPVPEDDTAADGE